jgi:hypothetical protein
VDELKDGKRHIPLSAKDMALMNPNTTAVNICYGHKLFIPRDLGT